MTKHKGQYILFSLLVVLSILLSSCGGGGSAKVEPPTIRVVTGTVQAGTGGSLADAKDNTALAAGSTVKTGDASRATLTFKDGSSVEVEPNTEVALTDGSGINLQVNSGKVWAASFQNQITADAGGPVATGKGGSFSVERAGTDVTVSATGSPVSFKAGGSEVKVPSGQMSKSSGGGAPSAPANIQVKNALKISLTGEALLYLADPQGRATGYHPTKGIVVNQIPDSFYGGKEARPQVLTVPNVAAGEYTILLVAANNQSSWKIEIGTAGSDLQYKVYETSSSITWGTPTGITMKLLVADDGTITPEISNTWTLYVEPPGKVALADELKRTKITYGAEVPAWVK